MTPLALIAAIQRYPELGAFATIKANRSVACLQPGLETVPDERDRTASSRGNTTSPGIGSPAMKQSMGDPQSLRTACRET